MKLKLSKAWYENRAKIENGCSEIAAGISLKPNLENDSTTSTKKNKQKHRASASGSKAEIKAKPSSQGHE